EGEYEIGRWWVERGVLSGRGRRLAHRGSLGRGGEGGRARGRLAEPGGARDGAPRRFRLNGEVIVCGHSPALEVAVGSATTIATGGGIPRGAEAVALIEHKDLVGAGGAAAILLRRAATPWQCTSYARCGMARGRGALT